jgi:hypothetical protein
MISELKSRPYKTMARRERTLRAHFGRVMRGADIRRGHRVRRERESQADRRTTVPSAIRAVPTSTIAASSRTPGIGKWTCCTATADCSGRTFEASCLGGAAAEIDPATSVHPTKTAVPTNLRMTRTPDAIERWNCSARRAPELQAGCHASRWVFLNDSVEKRECALPRQLGTEKSFLRLPHWNVLTDVPPC